MKLRNNVFLVCGLVLVLAGVVGIVIGIYVYSIVQDCSSAAFCRIGTLLVMPQEIRQQGAQYSIGGGLVLIIGVAVAIAARERNRRGARKNET